MTSLKQPACMTAQKTVPCTCWPAVPLGPVRMLCLAILPVHAQPVQGVRAQQAQRMHHRNAHIYMALVSSGVPQDQLWICLAVPGERGSCGTHAGVLPVDNASTVMPKTAGCAGKENGESAGGEGWHSHIKNSRKAL